MPVAVMAPVPPTTHTSGFVEAQTPSFGFGGGGLGSSPNVPKPGTSINPATGLPNTAGITRAELAAQRELQAGAAQGTGFGAAAGTTGAGKPLAELDGREQAARQLTGTVDPTAVKTLPAPGTAPNAPSTFYEDVEGVLNKVGEVAFSVIPNQIKEVLSAHPTGPGGQPVPAAPAVPEAEGTHTRRRSSIANILDSAKEQISHAAHDIQENFNNSQLVSAQRRGSATGQSYLTQVKDLVGSIVNSSDSIMGIHAAGAASRVSMPSNELAGAQPGEFSTGAGALPGKSTEAGVAILPDEKNLSGSLPSQENQGMLPGETSGGVGALPGPSSEAGVAIVPDERAAASKSVATTVASSSNAAAPVAASSGLAPALPETSYGQGAAKGATKVETTAAAGVAAGAAGAGLLAASNVPATTHSADRADSSASVTAIRGGHEGNAATTASPLAAAGNTTTAATTSATPGDAANGVGHPASRVAREPGTYPVPEHDGVAHDAKDVAAESKNIVSTEDRAHPSGAATVIAHDNKVQNGDGASTLTNGASTNGAASSTTAVHRRTSSGDSSGKKKIGFMNKLKGEMKVISGKIANDDSKIAEGERLKHGE